MANGTFTTMNGKDAIFGALGECYITIDSKRYNFMQLINIEAEIEKNKVEVPILGKTGKGNKAAGWTGSGSATMHYNQSVFRKALETYKDSGEDMYFDCQITNCDGGSDAGTQTVTLKDCNLDGGILAKLDADGDYLDEDVDFTFEDFTINEEFSKLTGFVTSSSDEDDEE